MNSEGMMRRARRPYLVLMLAFLVPVAFAQAPPARDHDELDVTMRVIVDPNAKVPDEIVRKIQLPKPATPATSSDKKNDTGDSNGNGKSNDGSKPSDPGSQGKGHSPDARGQGREFGQQVSEDAKQRSEEARQNHGKPPDKPPRGPPDRPKPPKPGS